MHREQEAWNKVKRDEPRGERWSLDELKRVERLEKVRQNNLLKLKTRVGKFQFGKNNANTTGFA